jgi:hypothetical protein
MKEGMTFSRTTALRLLWLQQSRGLTTEQHEEAEQRTLVRGSAKKRKVVVACGNAVTAVEVVGQSTERQLSWPRARATSWARLGEVEAEVAVIDEESTMRFGARMRWCCEPGLLEMLDVGAGTADMAALAPAR